MTSLTASAVFFAATLAVWQLTRKYDRAESTLDGARSALSAVGDSAKWMAGIQMAALAGVSWLLRSDVLGGHPLRVTIGGIAFGFIVLSLLLCGWVLAALPSIHIRIHGLEMKGRDKRFDVYETSIYAADSPRLGNVMALQHWYWALSLVCLAVAILWH